MNRKPLLSLIAVIAFTLVSSRTQADPADISNLAIGDKAPDFKLPGVDGKDRALKEFVDAKVLVIAFTCNHCPTAQAYEERFANFSKEYGDKGVAFVAISPNDPKAVRLDELGYTDLDDSFESMKVRAKETNIAYPYLYDGDTQSVAKAFGVLATPHIFIFDADRKLRYVGRWDDSEVKTVKSHDATNAVDALLAGKPVPVEKTRVVGCSTKWADKQADATASLAKWDAEPVELKMLKDSEVAALAKNDGKTLRLVNLWATWCGPCVAELPELVTINRMYRGRNFELVTISLDVPEKGEEALRVLKANKVAATNYHLKTDSRDAFADALDKEWPGPVPYTILIAPGGKILYRKSGPIETLELKKAIVSYLGRTF